MWPQGGDKAADINSVICKSCVGQWRCSRRKHNSNSATLRSLMNIIRFTKTLLGWKQSLSECLQLIKCPRTGKHGVKKYKKKISETHWGTQGRSDRGGTDRAASQLETKCCCAWEGRCVRAGSDSWSTDPWMPCERATEKDKTTLWPIFAILLWLCVGNKDPTLTLKYLQLQTIVGAREGGHRGASVWIVQTVMVSRSLLVLWICSLTQACGAEELPREELLSWVRERLLGGLGLEEPPAASLQGLSREPPGSWPLPYRGGRTEHRPEKEASEILLFPSSGEKLRDWLCDSASPHPGQAHTWFFSLNHSLWQIKGHMKSLICCSYQWHASEHWSQIL